MTCRPSATMQERASDAAAQAAQQRELLTFLLASYDVVSVSSDEGEQVTIKARPRTRTMAATVGGK